MLNKCCRRVIHGKTENVSSVSLFPQSHLHCQFGFDSSVSHTVVLKDREVVSCFFLWPFRWPLCRQSHAFRMLSFILETAVLSVLFLWGSFKFHKFRQESKSVAGSRPSCALEPFWNGSPHWLRPCTFTGVHTTALHNFSFFTFAFLAAHIPEPSRGKYTRSVALVLLIFL